MTTKTVSTYIVAGYVLAAQYSTLDITRTGAIGGAGVLLNHGGTLVNGGRISADVYANGVTVEAQERDTSATISNTGVIKGDNGIVSYIRSNVITNDKYIGGGGNYYDSDLHGDGVSLAAGRVVNHGTITGLYNGVSIGGNATVTNYGYINGNRAVGVNLTQGVVYNGGLGSIFGDQAGVRTDSAASQVTNDGTISGGTGSGTGIYLQAGGVVNNLQDGDIAGSGGVYAPGGVAMVTNAGEIYGIAGSAVDLRAGGTVTNSGTILSAHEYGVLIAGAAVVTNGSTADYSALIRGSVYLQGSGELSNFGTIEAGDGTYAGVTTQAVATVTNFGAIEGQNGGTGVYLHAGGVADNLQDGDITGSDGVYATGGVAIVINAGEIYGDMGPAVDLRAGGTVTNSGTILSAHEYGVVIAGAAVVTNGSEANSSALIRGSVYLQGSGELSNFGTIVAGEGTMTGVRTGAGATVTNFGKIQGQAGSTGVAVQLGLSSTLIVEAGCSFVGAAQGDVGTLVLANGDGVLGLLSAETVTVSGSMALTTFAGFGDVEIAVGATFSTSGKVTIGISQSVVDSGSLTLGSKKNAIGNNGTIEVLAGAVTVSGNVTGKGSAWIGGGLLDFTAAFNQNVTFAGTAGTLELAQSQGYNGNISGFGQAGGMFLDLADIGFTNSGEATYSGTKKGGVLTVTDGTHTAHVDLTGNYGSSTFVAANDGHGGTEVVAKKSNAAPVLPHTFIAAMAGLGPTEATPTLVGESWFVREPLLTSPRATVA